MRSIDRTAARAALLMALPAGIVGVSFGALATSSGVPAALACACSLLVFAGGAQFAALGVLAGGGSGLAAVLSGLLLNARYIAFGIAVAPRLRGGVARRALAAHLLIDESAALALGEPDPARAERAFWWTGAAIFVSWNLGTLAGAAGATAIADPRALGIDAALPAAMLALLWPLLRARRGRWVAALGAATALGALFVAPPGIAILSAAAAAPMALLIREPHEVSP